MKTILSVMAVAVLAVACGKNETSSTNSAEEVRTSKESVQVNVEKAPPESTWHFNYVHKNFSGISLTGDEAKKLYATLQVRESESESKTLSKVSIDGRILCENFSFSANHVGKFKYRCLIYIDSSDGDIIRTWAEQ